MNRSFLTACAVFVAGSVSAGAGPHVEALQSIDRYCRASWQQARISAQDWDDCTQEVFLELLNRIDRERWKESISRIKTKEHQELKRSIWCVVKRWQRAQRFQSLTGEEVVDQSSANENERQELREGLQMLMNRLTSRQQKIVAHTIEGASTGEIAKLLGISPERVSDEKYKATQKLRAESRFVMEA